MITLFTFGGDDNQPSFSPFCVKAMILLDLSGASWVPKFIANPMKMPHGKLPVIDVAGQMIPDSSAIQAYLEGEGAQFDSHLTAGERATAHALRRMMEEHTVQALVHDRWMNDDCWAVMKGRFFGTLPALPRRFVPALARASVRKSLNANGMARYTEEERLARIRADFTALTDQLGQKSYLFGDTPSSVDAFAIPMLDMIRTLPCDTGLRRMLAEFASLTDYAKRGRALYPAL